MRLLLNRGFLVLMGVVVVGAGYVINLETPIYNLETKEILKEQVLGVADSIENMIFRVASPLALTIR